MISNRLLKFCEIDFFCYNLIQKQFQGSSMQVDNALLTRLEKLSYLKVSDDKREEIISQLSEIVSFVDNLNELNTDNVDDKFSMTNQATFAREDVENCNRGMNDDILNHAPDSQDHFFIVPKIIE